MTTEEPSTSWSFHPPEVEDELHRRLTGRGPAPPLFLAGDPGSGRRYLLARTAERARREGVALAVTAVDLAGYEEDAASFAPFLDLQAARLAAVGRPVAPAHRAQIEEIAGAVEISASGALLLALLLELDHPDQRLASLPGELFVQVPDPGRDARARLSLLLAHLSRDEVRVVHLLAPEPLSAPLFAWLAAETAKHANLRLAVSASPAEATPAGAVRLDFAPLDAAQVRAAVDRALRPVAFPEELYAALAQASAGLPALLQHALADLAAHGLLVHDGGGSWRLRGEESDEDEILERLDLHYLAPWEELLNRLTPRAAGQVQRLLSLAALCGENVPADLLLHYMEVPEAEHEAILDLFDEELTEGDLALFVDHQYGHPSFPGHPIYSFTAALPRRLLAGSLKADPRRQTASDLLEFLRQVPVETKGMAGLFLALSRELADPAAADGFRRELAFWVGPEEAAELAALLAGDLQSGAVSAEAVLTAAVATRGRWPAYRRLALLDALVGPGVSLAREARADVQLLRSEVLTHLGRHADALADAEHGLALAREIHGDEHPRAIEAGLHVALLLRELGRAAEAREPLERLVPAARRLHGEGHPMVLSLLNALGSVLSDLGDLENARVPMAEVVAIGRASYGDRHPALAPSLNNLAALEQALGDREASRAHFEEALAILRGAYGDGNPSVAMVLHNYAQLLFDLEELDAACARLAEAHAIATAAFGPDHPFTAQLTRQREVRCAAAG